jgi:uncharacterized protein YjbI with pentapeptide repeats
MAPSILDALFSMRKSHPSTLSDSVWDILKGTFAIGIADFFSKVEVEKPISSSELSYLLESLLKRADILGEQAPSLLSSDHLLQPLKVPIFRDFSRALPEEVKRFKPIRSIQQNRRLLEKSVSDALQEVRNQKPEAFAGLEQFLSASLTDAMEKRNAAARHESFLIRAFHQNPIFGQEESGITLSHLYVEQRCTWRTPSDSEAAADEDEGELTGDLRKQPEHMENVGRIHDVLHEWLSQKDSSTDHVRVVAGGPGSGKSTFARAFAIEVIDSGAYDVLFIPLQELDSTGSFDTRVSNLFRKRTELGFDRVNSPLEWMGRTEPTGDAPSKPLLLVCDGLDELAPPDSKEAANATTEFVQALGFWLGNRNSAGVYAKALVLGRTIAAEEAFSRLGIDHRALLTIGGFLPLNNPSWNYKQKKGLIADPHDLAGEDQRREYWEKWCSAHGVKEDLPKALSGDESEAEAEAEAVLELTAEPLLLYLLIWTGYLGEHWPAAASNRNVVYREMFALIYRRDWGVPKPQPANRPKGGHVGTSELTLDEFLRLQEALGLASWATGGRTVAANKFPDLIKVYLPADKVEDLGDLDSVSLKTVALQSYTRSAEGGGEGYEFVHKTLGEFLIGRALAFTVKRALEHIKERQNETRLREAAEIIGQVARIGVFSEVIARFFIDELRLDFAEEDLHAILETQIVSLVGWAVRNRMPVHQNARALVISMAELQREEVRSFDVLWTTMQCLCRMCFAHPVGQLFDVESLPVLTIPWGSGGFLPTFASLVNTAYAQETNRVASFRHLDISSQGLTDYSFGAIVYDSFGEGFLGPAIWLPADFAGSNVSKSSFWSSQLDSANFTDAILDGSRFSSLNMNGVKASHASMRDTHFYTSTIVSGDLRGVDLSDCRLVDTVLESCELSGANLSNAKVYMNPERSGRKTARAIFQKIELASSTLEGGIFLNVQFSEVDLSDCCLDRALFLGCTFEEVNFQRSTFVGATFGLCTFLHSKMEDEQSRSASWIPADQAEARLTDMLSKREFM